MNTVLGTVVDVGEPPLVPVGALVGLASAVALST